MVQKTKGRHRLVMWYAALLASAAPAASAQDDSALERALHYLTRHDAGEIRALFDSVRPAPVSGAERARSLAMLPAAGDVRDLDTAQRTKVAAVRRVLALHQREAVYVIKVIAVPQAVVALHDRAVVLVSEQALDLLDAEELQALVAHEVGHEYFWGAYFQGRRDNSQSSLRRLELLCDGIAVITLQRLELNPRRLTAALEKIDRYNRDRFGIALTENNYPALGERSRFVGRFVEWLGRSGAASPSRYSDCSDRGRSQNDEPGLGRAVGSLCW